MVLTDGREVALSPIRFFFLLFFFLLFLDEDLVVLMECTGIGCSSGNHNLALFSELPKSEAFALDPMMWSLLVPFLPIVTHRSVLV